MRTTLGSVVNVVNKDAPDLLSGGEQLAVVLVKSLIRLVLSFSVMWGETEVGIS